MRMPIFLFIRAWKMEDVAWRYNTLLTALRNELGETIWGRGKVWLHCARESSSTYESRQETLPRTNVQTGKLME